MRRCIFFFLLTLSPLTVWGSLNCLTCSDETCHNLNQWVLERCPPETKFCYRFVNNYDRVYGLGCSIHEQCEQIGGYVLGTKCSTCQSDACNGQRQLHTVPPGGGAVWSASATTTLFSITTIVSLLDMLVMQPWYSI